MASKEDPIKAIANSPLKDVIVKGFAEVYKVKPDFPVQFLAKWLKHYSLSQTRRQQLEDNKTRKQEEVAQMQRNKLENANKVDDENRRKEANLNKQEADFISTVKSTKFLSDLLVQILPETIEKFCSSRKTPLTGCYVGQLKHRHKKLQEHNFQPGTQYDTENPKVIEYFGASKSHQFMRGQILPNQSGRSYEVFKEEEPPAQEEEGKPAKIKKKYVYVPLVQRDDKMYFFKFPKLGSFACFPLKIKSCLFSESFNKGIGDYKAFVKNKEEIQKQYNEKLNEAKGNYEESKRKLQDHEVNEEDPISHGQHANLQEEVTKTQQALKEIQINRPIIEPFQYDTKIQEYVISMDTMGKDSQISEQILTFIESKLDFFRKQWEDKEYNMLLSDILTFIEDQPTLESQDNYFREQERGIISSNESHIKQQFPNRQKEPQFELTLIKVKKLISILSEDAYLKSMKTYLSYNIPKHKEIVQIILMILGYQKSNINLPRSNTLDGRKCLSKQFLEKMLQDLQKYELRRQSSESVDPEYKINKLMERLEKIDSEAVSKYNSWLSVLLAIAKSICWARIQCRDAKIEAHEAKNKAMNQREAEIAKYEEDLAKAIETAKAEVTEETPPFNEQEFLKTYAAENPKPQRLVVEELKSFLDIE